MFDLIIAVDKGAELLDEMKPNWRLKVALGDLDQSDPYKCVLGQVYGEYTAGLTALFGAPITVEVHEKRFEYGFSYSAIEPDGSDDEDGFEKLTRLWKAKLQG